MNARHRQILDAIRADVHQVPEVFVQRAACAAMGHGQMVGILARPAGAAPEEGRAGLGAVAPEVQGRPCAAPAEGLSCRELATPLLSGEATISHAASWALAAINATLPTPAGAAAVKGQDIMRQLGTGRNVTVVGHFPFVERMAGEFASFHVLERNPRPGDLDNRDGSAAATVLPGADVAVITGTTLLNGTLGTLLELLPTGCTVILLGPSTPFAPSLLECGIHVLAGAAVLSPAETLAAVSRGCCFRALPGVEHLAWAGTMPVPVPVPVPGAGTHS